MGCLLTLLAALPDAHATMPPAPGQHFPQEYVLFKHAHPELFDLRGGLDSWVDRAQARRVAFLSGARSVRINPLTREVVTESGAVPLRSLAVAGTVRVPVVPVLFTPNTAPAPPTTARINEILFTGPHPPFGTAHDYYTEISYGLLNLVGTVFPYSTLPNTDIYYAGTSNGLVPATSRTGELIRDALDQLDPGTNFGQFDNDGPDGTPNSGDDDGFVDLVAFLQPEPSGECDSGVNGNIWAHRWVYRAWTAGNVPYSTNDAWAGHAGGVIRIDNYTIQSAETCTGAEMQIGTFCHETGHIFGIRDLYDTDGSSEGDGHWSLMAAGGWNTQDSPAHMSVFEKAKLGWVLPTSMTSTVNGVSIPQIETNPYALQITVGNGEHFLIENRQAVGFDRNLLSCGLAIWHLDAAVMDAKSSSNSVNRKENCGAFVETAGEHYALALVQADNQCHLEADANRGDAGDVYPGSTTNRNFTPTSSPNSNRYAGPSGIRVANISNCAANMTADITAFPISTTVGPVDVVFLIDHSGSYLDDWPNIKAQMPSIVSALQANFPDIRFGLATFVDFPFAPFGGPADIPYQVLLPLSANNSAAFLNAVAAITPPAGGSDLPEDQYEALHQLLSGAGRDLFGNGVAGDQTGEIAPSAMGWGPTRTRIVYLMTDSDFHDSDSENYPTGTTTVPAPTREAAGRMAVRAEVAALGNALTLFVLVSDTFGPYANQGPEGEVPNVPPTLLQQQAAELTDLTGGGMFTAGVGSVELATVVSTTISVIVNQPGVNRPPDCSRAVASAPMLWPPNHKFSPITVQGVTDPDGDPVSITITGVTQDEPLNGNGDGNTCPDAQFAGSEVSVRAERSGKGNGRVYAINFMADDGLGGTCSGTISVCVPHDGARPACVDDGQRYASDRCRNPVKPATNGPEFALRVTQIGTRAGIEFKIPADAIVQIGVFDVSGRQVATLENSVLSRGEYERSWDMSGVANGVYFVRLKSGTVSLTKTVLRLR